MTMRRYKWLAVLVGFAAPGLSQPAQAPALPAVSMLQPGQWALRSREDPTENRSICVADPRMLLQVRHSGANCNRFVIESHPKDATVHYTCPGHGHGRTTIRVESSRLVHIESQGIANREPFAVLLEGRRTGDCGTVTGVLRR
jgi:hypothetical protein